MAASIARAWRGLLAVACLALLLVAARPGACAEEEGKLKEFEKDVTQTQQTDVDTHDGHHHPRDKDDDDEDESFLGQFFGVVVKTAIQGMGLAGRDSWYRVADPSRCAALRLAPRQPGELTLPYARFDQAYRSVDLGLDALDLRAELGCGPVGVQYNEMHYRERQPRDELMITELYGLYRMAATPDCEVDLGLGQVTVHGTTRTNRFSATLPIRCRLAQSPFAVEFRPAWASRLSDYDLALLYGGSFLNLKAGYRWVLSPSQSLNGLYLGVAARY